MRWRDGSGHRAHCYHLCYLENGPVLSKVIEKPALEEGLRSSPTHVIVSQSVCQGPLSGNGRSTPILRSAG